MRVVKLVPPKDEQKSAQSSMSKLPSARRKQAKRPLTIDSDDEEDARPYSAAPNSATKTRVGHPHTADAPGSDVEEEDEWTMDPDSRFLHQSTSRVAPSSNPRSKNVRPKPKAGADGPLPAKKKRIVVSEPNSDEEYAANEDAVQQVAALAALDDDGNSAAEHKRHTKAKGKARTSTKSTKETIPPDVEDVIRDGSKATPPGQAGNDSLEYGAMVGSKRGRPRQPSKLEDTVVDVVGDSASTPDPHVTHSPLESKQESPAPVAKKRKLPTIKKNKILESAGQSTPSSATAPTKATASTGPSKPPTLEGNKSSVVSAGARKIPATAGNTDFDLRNKSVYAELFKSAGGSTPRSGLNRREKDEERRKELNKLRDEAKAKRLLEAKETFDLQGQPDQISRFEEKLKYDRSSALYPNFLAAKWRELWERERRKRKEKEHQENRHWRDIGVREDGEMNA